MLYSEMEWGCGINSWLSNSVVRHAISASADALGPYIPLETIWPIFSHEPTLATAPTGETVIFFTHLSHSATIAGTCNCSTGNSTADCPPDWDKARGRNLSAPLLTFMSYTEDFRSWSDPIAVPQADPFTDTAFSATILSNGAFSGEYTCHKWTPEQGAKS